jgi:hypothetical protein
MKITFCAELFMLRREGRLVCCMRSEGNREKDSVNADDRGVYLQELRRNQPLLMTSR